MGPLVVAAEEAAAADDAAEKGANSGITRVLSRPPGAIHRDSYWVSRSNPQGWQQLLGILRFLQLSCFSYLVL